MHCDPGIKYKFETFITLYFEFVRFVLRLAVKLGKHGHSPLDPVHLIVSSSLSVCDIGIRMNITKFVEFSQTKPSRIDF